MFRRVFTTLICTSVFVLGVSGSVQAAEQIPEVDPSSMAAAVALLAASGSLVVDRIRRKLFAR